jgi:hypothetical protein
MSTFCGCSCGPSALDDPDVRAKVDALAPTLPRYPDGTPTRAQLLAAMHSALAV